MVRKDLSNSMILEQRAEGSGGMTMQISVGECCGPRELQCKGPEGTWHVQEPIRRQMGLE